MNSPFEEWYEKIYETDGTNQIILRSETNLIHKNVRKKWNFILHIKFIEVVDYLFWEYEYIMLANIKSLSYAKSGHLKIRMPQNPDNFDFKNWPELDASGFCIFRIMSRPDYEAFVFFVRILSPPDFVRPDFVMEPCIPKCIDML